MAEPLPSDPLETLVGFARELRRRGLSVGTDRIVTFCRCVDLLGPADREAVYWSARSALLSRREDVEVLDAAFERYFDSAIVSLVRGSVPSLPPADPSPLHDAAREPAAADGAP